MTSSKPAKPFGAPESDAEDSEEEGDNDKEDAGSNKEKEGENDEAKTAAEEEKKLKLRKGKFRWSGPSEPHCSVLSC